MYLIIDDCRSLGCDIIARTAAAGKTALLAMHGNIQCLCIDHDLGCDEDGYDVIKWAITKKCLPSHVQIVSQNPGGRKRIADALCDIGYTTCDNTNYHRDK